MRTYPSAALALVVMAMAISLPAQQSVPTLAQPIPAQFLGPTPLTLDLRNYFGVPGIGGPVVQFTTVAGRFNVELLSIDAPRHVNNFLAYVNNRTWDNSIFHHVNPVGSPGPALLQGGALSGLTIPPTIIPAGPAVALEYRLPNTRGTLAAGRGTDPNSARNEWFFNLADNTNALGPAGSNGAYSVFGRVLGSGMAVVDTLSQFPRSTYLSLPSIPLRGMAANQTTPTVANFVAVNSVREVPVFPIPGGESSVLTFTSTRTNPQVVAVSVNGSGLTLSPLSIGTSVVTVRAVDTNNNSAETTFTVNVTTQPVFAPLFTGQPVSQTVAAGSTVVLGVTATGSPIYQWFRNNVAIPGATSASLVIETAVAANAGSYLVRATNSIGATTSASATLQVNTTPEPLMGRLTNLSVLTTARELTVGAVVGPANSTTTLPLLVRQIGPTLAEFEVPEVLTDPEFIMYRGGSRVPIAHNDNWGGTAALNAAFARVGAFRLPAASRDAAVQYNAAPGTYTIDFYSRNHTRGTFLAELYDAVGLGRTAGLPRLINISTLADLNFGEWITLGFVIEGATSRTVLVRAVGPTLEKSFGVFDAVEDPKLELFDTSQTAKIGENDDWGGDPQLVRVMERVGAFRLPDGLSKDSAILVTLPPGSYTARATGIGNAAGWVIVEVYEVP